MSRLLRLPVAIRYILVLLVLVAASSVNPALADAGGGVVVSGSHESVTVVLPTPTGGCSVDVRNATIGSLVVVVGDGCRGASIVVSNSSIDEFEAWSRGGVLSNVLVMESHVGTAVIEGAGLLDVEGSRLATLNASVDSLNINGSVFGGVVVAYTSRASVEDSRGGVLTARARGGSPVLIVRDLAMSCSRPFGGLYASGSGGSVYASNVSITCTGGRSEMLLEGFSRGIIEGLVMNNSNSSLQWVSGRSGVLVVNDSVVYGNVSITALGAEGRHHLPPGSGNSAYASLQPTGASQVLIMNSIVGKIVRTGNESRLPAVSVSITAREVLLVNSSSNSVLMNVFAGNTSIVDSKLTVRRLSLFLHGHLKVAGTRLSSPEAYVVAVGDSSVVFNGSQIASKGIVYWVYNGTFNLSITGSRVLGAATMSVHIVNSTVYLGVNGSIIDRSARILLIGYPPLKGKAFYATSKSYYGSILGPAIIVGDRLVRPGGAVVEFLNLNASITVRDWYGDPGLQHPYMGAPENTTVIEVANASVLPALEMLPGSNRSVYLVSFERPVGVVKLVSSAGVSVEVYSGSELIASGRGAGVVEVQLPGEYRELVLVVRRVPLVNTTSPPAEASITTSTNPPLQASRSKGVLPPAVLLAALVLLGVIFWVWIRSRKPSSYTV